MVSYLIPGGPVFQEATNSTFVIPGEAVIQEASAPPISGTITTILSRPTQAAAGSVSAGNSPITIFFGF